MSPYILPKEEPLRTKLNLNDFDITENGFLPSQQPLQRLPNPYYHQWEQVARDLPQLIKSRQIRQEIQRLPVLSTKKLHTASEWRRAYVLLAFMTHAYTWGGDSPAEILPRSLAEPFLLVSQHLELPPVATYAALCLWNYQHTDPESPTFEDSTGLRMMNNLTGTLDEEWFYLISVMVEAQGARSIPLMIDAIHAADQEEHELVTEALNELRDLINQLGDLLERMYEHCAPSVFYHDIRPLLAGSKNMSAAGLPRGVYFDLGPNAGQWRQLRGGSNAQSSLIQFFDAVLGIVHRATGESTRTADPPFHQEMRQYMPGPHRRFLETISQAANLQEFALQDSAHPLQTQLRRAYQGAVDALSAFRSIHMQMVARYIIVPSRQVSEPGRMNLAVASSGEMASASGKGLVGTGGTDLIPFLKQTREETDQAAVGRD